MGTLIDGKEIARKIREKVAEKARYLKEQKNITPKLAVILVGDDKPSQTYVRKKGEAAEKAGIQFSLYTLSADIQKEEIINKIHEIQQDTELSGLIVQLPLPEPKYTDDVLNAIRPEVDIDCLTDINLGKLMMKTNDIVPPTPGAVMSILQELKVDLIGKNVTIIGVGPLVGKPLAVMMMNERASVTTCNSRTRDTKEKCLQADIIVTGVGQKDVLRGDMVREGAIVIDTGVCFVEGKMYGDVNVEEVIQKAAFVTPTPGGVGPITVARLLSNTIICAEKIYDDANLQIECESTDTTNLQINTSLHPTEKIIYPELSYKINGILFKAHNDLGRYCNEKQACDKIEQYLKDENIAYEREKILPPCFTGEKKGRNKIDFLIENKIIIEVKAKRFLEKEDYYQIQRYLHAFDKKLGVLINFRDERINPKRILNSTTNA